jgi:hypothetical protein
MSDTGSAPNQLFSSFSPGGANSPATPETKPSLSPREAAHAAALTNFKQIKSADTNMTNIRRELDKLSALGDQVTSSELMDSAARLVGKGLPAAQVAVLLADAPDEGAALAGWISSHDETVTANEQKVSQALDVARHQLGVAALHELVHHVAGQGGQPTAPGQAPPGVGNALQAPGAGSSPSTPTLH